MSDPRGGIDPEPGWLHYRLAVAFCSAVVFGRFYEHETLGVFLVIVFMLSVFALLSPLR